MTGCVSAFAFLRYAAGDQPRVGSPRPTAASSRKGLRHAHFEPHCSPPPALPLSRARPSPLICWRPRRPLRSLKPARIGTALHRRLHRGRSGSTALWPRRRPRRQRADERAAVRRRTGRDLHNSGVTSGPDHRQAWHWKPRRFRHRLHLFRCTARSDTSTYAPSAWASSSSSPTISASRPEAQYNSTCWTAAAVKVGLNWHF